VEAAAGRVPVIAGTGALSTRETVELSVHAEQAGAAAVMIIPPFYDAPSWRELKAHFGAVADAISIPVMYYNMPGVSGTTLTAEQLAELPGVTCLKDTGGDATFAQALIHGDGPTLLNGFDTHTFHALATGVQSVVWGAASVVPEQCVELHRLLIDDIDLPAARELWARLWAVCDVLESVGYTAGVKAGARVTGFTTGPVRGPLLELEAADQERLAAAIEHATVASVR
jgi:dihydrodipicolinate synthase/N-acetylneuraminate lyase